MPERGLRKTTEEKISEILSVSNEDDINKIARKIGATTNNPIEIGEILLTKGLPSKNGKSSYIHKDLIKTLFKDKGLVERPRPKVDPIHESVKDKIDKIEKSQKIKEAAAITPLLSSKSNKLLKEQQKQIDLFLQSPNIPQQMRPMRVERKIPVAPPLPVAQRPPSKIPVAPPLPVAQRPPSNITSPIILPSDAPIKREISKRTLPRRLPLKPSILPPRPIILPLDSPIIQLSQPREISRRTSSAPPRTDPITVFKPGQKVHNVTHVPIGGKIFERDPNDPSKPGLVEIKKEAGKVIYKQVIKLKTPKKTTDPIRPIVSKLEKPNPSIKLKSNKLLKPNRQLALKLARM
jgi:hypothetical protein